MQSLLPGSVSKYCLQQSPIPVIVVRPSTKREKKKKKRLADPSRRSYNQILEMSERRGSHIFDPSSSADSNVARLPDEEAAVAKVLGLPQSYTNSRSSLSTSERSSVDDLTSPNVDGRKSPSGESLASTENERVHDVLQSQQSELAPARKDESTRKASDNDSGNVSEKGDNPANIQVIVTEDMSKNQPEAKG